MATLYWKGGTSTDIGVVSNWVTTSGGSTNPTNLNGLTDGTDDVVFNYATSGASNNALIDSSMSNSANGSPPNNWKSLTIEYHASLVKTIVLGSGGQLTLAGLEIKQSGTIFATHTSTIKFAGTPKFTTSDSGEFNLYIKLDSTNDSELNTNMTSGIFDSAVSRSNVTFLFAPSTQNIPLVLQNGLYPNMDFHTTSSTAILNVQSLPYEDRTNVFYGVDMLNLDVDTSFKVLPLRYNFLDKSKHFKITGTLTLTTDTFNMGLSTFELVSTTTTLKFPTTGTYGVENQFTSKFTNVIIGTPVEEKNFVTVEDNTSFACEHLHIKAGGRLYGPDYGSDSGSEIHCVQPVTVEGDWNFSQISDGVYRTTGTTMRLSVNDGGTGLNFVDKNSILYGNHHGALGTLALGTAGKVLAVNSSANGLEWSATAGGTAFSVSDITGATELASGLASTDELVLSDAGALKRMDISVLQTYMQSNLTFTTNTDVDVSVANLKTRLAGGFGSNAVQIGDSDDVVTIGNDLIVTGDLTVSGDTTTVNTATLDVEDLNITVGKAATTSAATDGAGLTFGAWSSGTIPTLTWVHADSRLAVNKALYSSGGFVGSLTGDVTGNVSGSSGSTTGNAATATKVTVTDNESTSESNLITFVAGAATSTGVQDLEMDGTFTYNPALGRVDATKFRATETATDPSLGIDVQQTATGTNDGLVIGGRINVVQSGIVASGQNRSLEGLKIDMDLEYDASGAHANVGTVSGKGININVTGETNGTSTATGVHINASGTDNNYALIAETGSVGIGTTSPANTLHVNSGGSNGVAKFESTDNMASIAIADNDTAVYVVAETNYGSFGGTNDLTATNLNIHKTTGYVGIGTTSPTAKLQVLQNNAAWTILAGADLSNPTLTDNTRKFMRLGMPHYDTDEENFSLITGDADNGQNKLFIGGGTSIGNAATDIFFHTAANSTTTTGTTRMTIKGSGNVGIGTTAPAVQLHVAGTADQRIRVQDTTDNYAVTMSGKSNGSFLFFGDIDSGEDSFMTLGAFSGINNLDTESRDFHLYGTNTTTGFYFDESAGKFGIGTSSPDSQLDISSASTATLRLSNSDTQLTEGQITGEIIFYQDDDSGSADGITGRIGMRSSKRSDGTYYGNAGDMGFFVAGSGNYSTASQNADLEAMSIRAGGNVGIGTTDPDAKLHVEGSVLIDAYEAGAGAGLFFREGFLNTNQPSITVQDHSGANPDGLAISAYDGISFRLNAVEKARFDSNGNLGIGTTSPETKLHVDNGTLQLGLQADSLYTQLSNNALMFHRAGASYIDQQVDNGDIRFRMNAANDDLLMLDGSTMRVGIRTTSPSNLLHIVGDMADGKQGILITRDDTSTVEDNMLGGIGFDSNDGNVPSKITEASVALVGYASEDHATTDKGGYLSVLLTETNDDDDTTSTEALRVSTVSAGTSSTLTIKNGNVSMPENTKYAGIDFHNVDSSGAGVGAAINALSAASGRGGYLEFQTGTTVGDLATKMTLTDTGQLDFADGGSIQLGNGAGATPASDHVRLSEAADVLRIDSENGYLEIGPKNSSYSHFQTDRGKYYFNTQISVDGGIVSSHDENLLLQRGHANTDDRITVAVNSMTFKSAGNDVVKIDGTNTRVGIGTTNPSSTLDVVGTIECTGLKLQNGTLDYGTGKQQSGDLAVGWWTVAYVAGRDAVGSYQRALGEFIINDVDSSRHGTVRFNATHFFGAGESIQAFAYNFYNVAAFTKLRIKSGGTYSGAALQVYVANANNNLESYMTMTEHTNSWLLLDTWLLDTESGGAHDALMGYSTDAWADFAVAEELDLSVFDRTNQGGIYTTGGLKAEEIRLGKLATNSYMYLSPDTDNSFILASGSGTDVTLAADDDLVLHADDDIFLQAGGATKMTLLNDGNVGIGTTAPSHTLHLSDSSRVDIKFSKDSSEDHYIRKDGDYLRFRGHDDSTILMEMRNNSSSNYVSFPGGNVGIGDTTPSYKLDVNGTLRATGNITGDSNITAAGYLTSNVGDGAFSVLETGAIFEGSSVETDTTAFTLHNGSLSSITYSGHYVNSGGNTSAGATIPLFSVNTCDSNVAPQIQSWETQIVIVDDDNNHSRVLKVLCLNVGAGGTTHYDIMSDIDTSGGEYAFSISHSAIQNSKQYPTLNITCTNAVDQNDLNIKWHMVGLVANAIAG